MSLIYRRPPIVPPKRELIGPFQQGYVPDPEPEEEPEEEAEDLPDYMMFDWIDELMQMRHRTG